MTDPNKNAGTEVFISDVDAANLAEAINATANGTTTTTSGDAKGDVETITGDAVGNLNDVLGSLPITIVEGETTKDNTINDWGTDSVEVKAPEAAGSITDIAAAAAVVAKEAVAPAPATGGTTTQRAPVKVNPIRGATDSGVKSASAPAETKPAVVAKPAVAGTVVKSTTAVPVQQLPEVVAAFDVAKPQTISALNNILEYCRLMHPGQHQTTQSIEKNQVSLLVSLKSILIAEDTNFNTVFKAVLAIIKVNRNDAFAITMRNRGLNGVSLATIDNVDMRFLTRLIDALHVASGVTDITTVKTLVDMNKLLGAINNVRAKNNLTAFFS